MPAVAPANRPQTLKQAKAAYKARAQPTLSEKEKRQLDRAIELDRRAWRSREADKKKAEAAKRRAEKEKKQKEEQERVRMGSQRRCDRFGYKSSQMHLGAFLNRNKMQSKNDAQGIQDRKEESEEDSFGDDGLDDETLLDAVDGASVRKTKFTNRASASNSTGSLIIGTEHPNATVSSHSDTQLACPTVFEDLNSFWDELDSSTQIARDLATSENSATVRHDLSQNSSLSADDFDLTAEDVEHLDPTPEPRPSKMETDRQLMPPPPLPRKPAQPETELTLSELESFIDDDLQLTQGDPG